MLFGYSIQLDGDRLNIYLLPGIHITWRLKHTFVLFYFILLCFVRKSHGAQTGLTNSNPAPEF